jgi:hypothetical protein
VRARFREGLAKSAKDAKERKQGSILFRTLRSLRHLRETPDWKTHFPTLITTQRGMLQVREKEAANPNGARLFRAQNTKKDQLRRDGQTLLVGH